MNFSNNSEIFQFNNSFEKPWDEYRFKPAGMILVMLAYTLIFIFGLVNNSLVVIAIYRTKDLQNVTNYFITSLAFSDILVCILIPATLLGNIQMGKEII